MHRKHNLLFTQVLIIEIMRMVTFAVVINATRVKTKILFSSFTVMRGCGTASRRPADPYSSRPSVIVSSARHRRGVSAQPLGTSVLTQLPENTKGQNYRSLP